MSFRSREKPQYNCNKPKKIARVVIRFPRQTKTQLKLDRLEVLSKRTHCRKHPMVVTKLKTLQLITEYKEKSIFCQMGFQFWGLILKRLFEIYSRTLNFNTTKYNGVASVWSVLVNFSFKPNISLSLHSWCQFHALLVASLLLDFAAK